jgi:type IV pilus assembly protein PilE
MSHQRHPDFAVPVFKRGWTLVELMIALVVLSIVTALAMPTFFDAVRKARRADAVAALSTLQQAQERWRSNNPNYADSLTTLRVGALSSAGHYDIVLSEASATGYTATASATSSSSQAQDTDCRSMRVAVAAGNIIYSARCATCENFNTQDPARCWKR